MYTRQSHVLDPLTEAASEIKGRKILWNDALEISFKEPKRVLSDDKLLTYPDWKIPFIVHTDASDKQVSDMISHKNKPIAFFSRILSKPQRNYTITEK